MRPTAAVHVARPDTARIGAHRYPNVRFELIRPVATVLAVLAGLPLVPSAMAESSFELTPFAAAVTGGEFESVVDASDVDLGSSAAYGLSFDLGAPGFDRHYQLYYSRQDTELDGPGAVDVDVQYLHIGGILDFPQERYVPYVVGTLGATRFSAAGPDYDDETRFSLALGGGFKIPLAEHFAVRLEARAFMTFVESESEFFCESVGGDARCLIRTSGNTFLQFAALAGLTFRF